MDVTHESEVFSYTVKLTITQHRLLQKWQEEQDKKVSARQGNSFPHYGHSCGYSWIITPGALGTTIMAENSITRERVDLTDYSSW